MERDGSGVSALLGLDGFVVFAQLLDDASGEWWLAVETTDDRAWLRISHDHVAEPSDLDGTTFNNLARTERFEVLGCPMEGVVCRRCDFDQHRDLSRS